MKIMKIAIYGFGKTGKAIYKELIKKYKIIPIKKYTFFKKNKLKKADLIILSLGNLSKLLGKKFPSSYDIRLKETKLNLKHVNSFSKKIKGLKTPVIVLTNHSDMFEKYLKNKLNRENIYAFGKDLDEKRFSDYLEKKIKAVGYHGLAIPLIKKLKKKDYFGIIKKVDKKLLNIFLLKRIDYELMANIFSKNFEKISKKDKEPKLNKVEKELLKERNIKFEQDYKDIFNIK